VAISKSGDYFGLDEYPNKEKDFDGHWGIYDEPYLQHVAQSLSQKAQPFFSTVFTLSSHHPYAIPAEKLHLFEKGTLPIHQAVRYTDYALKQFFEEAKKMPWYNQTIFVITADHSAENESAYYQSQQGKYEIPLLVFDPSHPQYSGDSSTIQHADILPMILSITYPGKYFAWSNYAQASEGFAIQYLNGYYQLIQWPWVYQFDGSKEVGLYNLRSDSLMSSNTINQPSTMAQQRKMSLLMRSYIQQYNHRLIHNQTTAE
jgi:phosphoglycerol transferase MdoB-like AlkP superfamily enzyme